MSWHMSDRFNTGRFALREVISISSEGAVLAHVNCMFGDGEQKARLIHASPDMLEALRELSTMFGEGLRTGILTQSMVDRALAAIAKAVHS